jgi:hypothetical protein
MRSTTRCYCVRSTSTQTADGCVYTSDDGVVHCRSEAQARYLKERLERRFRDCMLELHPEKTQIVCCHVGNQQHTQVSKKFDFLGYCFRSRLVRYRYGKLFVSFTPAISPRAADYIVFKCRLSIIRSMFSASLPIRDRPWQRHGKLRVPCSWSRPIHWQAPNLQQFPRRPEYARFRP